jgi:hypothetical protein
VRRRRDVNILYEQNFVTLLVVDEIVNELLREQDAVTSWAQPFGFPVL